MTGWTRRDEYRWDHKDGSFIVCELHGSSEERYFLFNRFRRELSNGKSLERMYGRHEELKQDFPEVFLNPLVSSTKEIQ
jgi:hypothetical protein